MKTKINSTKYAELRYALQEPGLWRFIADSHVVGPQYPTREALLNDLERYAYQFGCAGASLPPLHAAAPELLAALQIALKVIEKSAAVNGHIGETNAGIIVRAAIAKAGRVS